MYVRMSIMRPMPSRYEDVDRVLDQLIAVLASQDGYQGGLRLGSQGPDVRVWRAGFPADLLGRVTRWDSEESADRSAETEPVRALRMQLSNLVVDHQEYAFNGVDIPPTSA
jgi:hypothetical protein